MVGLTGRSGSLAVGQLVCSVQVLWRSLCAWTACQCGMRDTRGTLVLTIWISAQQNLGQNCG